MSTKTDLENSTKALQLFREMFTKEAAEPDQIYRPNMYVARSAFHDACKKSGIDIPDNPIEQMRWEKKIGLRTLATRLILSEYKRRGTEETKTERAMRLSSARAERESP